MRGVSIEERSVILAHYIIESKDTVRGAAKKFCISKSTRRTGYDCSARWMGICEVHGKV